MIRALALSLALVVLAAPPALAAGRMALLPLGGGANDPDVAQLEGALRSSIERITGRRLESPASTRELIASARQLGVDCEPSDLDCLLKLAVLVELDTLLVPSVSLGKDAYKLDLVFIDATSKSVKRSVQHVISPRSETFGKDVEGVAVDLLSPEKYLGSVKVSSNVAGAEVKLDGNVLGFTPIEQGSEVGVGQHLVVVSKNGASPFATVVDVRYGVLEEVHAELGDTGGGASPADALGAGDMMFLSGLTLASFGGALTLLSGCGALGADALLYTDMGAYAEREAVKNTGVVLLVTSAAALLVAAGGGTLLVFSMGD